MSERTLANPTVQVNNDVVGIQPNSTTFKSGKGEKKVRPQSSGGDSIEMVVTEDAETKKSMVKFIVYNTKSNKDLVEGWQDSDANTIRLSDGNFTKPFRQMVVINDPEWNLGADGNAEVVFEGAPSI